jgi:hypothetical protein
MGRTSWLVLTYTFFGPLVGAVAFMLMALIVDPLLSRPGESGVGGMIAHYWPLALTTGYVLGIVPGLLSSVIQIVADRRLPKLGLRLAAAPIIGSITSTVVLGLFFFSEGFRLGSDWWLFGAIAMTGGVAAFVSLSLVELFHKLPRPT